jgi:D-3-phosphoglycerate dehydrogenase
MPSISAEDAPKLKPYLKLAEQMGLLLGQITDSAIESVGITYSGAVSTLNTKPLTSVALASLLKASMDGVNMVSAPAVAKSRGIDITESFNDTADLQTSITIVVKSNNRTKIVTGTLFANQDPRLVNIDNVPVEVALTPNMLFVRNDDKPGLIGGIGTILGKADINVANFHLGRVDGTDEAVALVSVDSVVGKDVLEQLKSLPSVQQVKALKF